MLILFLRAVLLYCFILLILRMTGKRQVSDLEPYDLLITMSIADLASFSIADTSIPLLYSIVPILALYLVQQAIAKLCLHHRGFRSVICGSPLVLIRDGVLQEGMMHAAHYTVTDLCDHLRARDIFDMESVSYAILETNGGLSVLERTLQGNQQPGLPYMLITDGEPCDAAMHTLGISPEGLKKALKEMGVKKVKDVFYLQRMPEGTLRLQTRQRAGSVVKHLSAKEANQCFFG